MILSLLTMTFLTISGFSTADDVSRCPSDKRARCPSEANKPWSFDPELSNGPPHWSLSYPDCADNGMQSPINIPTYQNQCPAKTEGLVLKGYNETLTKAAIRNTGYAVEVIPNDGIDRTVTVNGVDYSLQNIILRVGNKTSVVHYRTVTPGSDHRIDGRQYAVELQFIHTSKERNGTVIISALLDPSFTPNYVLDDVITAAAIRRIQFENDTYMLDVSSSRANLEVFLPPGSPYYSYQGSFSTPPCTSGVTWLILKKIGFIGTKRLYQITSLHSVKKDDPHVDTCLIVNNFREPQNLGDREISGISMTEAAGCPSDKYAICPSNANKPWSFDPELSNGPPHWSLTYPNCADNGMQSPIDIPKIGNRRMKSGNGGLMLNGYEKPLKKAVITNNGYTVVVKPIDGIDRTVTFKNANYSLQNITLRIGNRSKVMTFDTASPGSDHRVDGQQYEAELQFIHHSGDNKSFVIISKLLGASYESNDELDRLMSNKALGKILFENDTFVQNGTETHLDNLVAPGSPFTTYQGSFSTPPCTPGVTWLIVKSITFIGVRQIYGIAKLHSVKENDPNVNQCFLVNSFRPPQNIGDRNISY